MLKNFEKETLFGRTKWPCFCFVFVYFYQFLSDFINKKGFFEASFVHFSESAKKCRKPTRRCGQHASSGMHATCEQHTQTSISASKSQYSFSCQLLPILLLYRIQRLLAARLIPPDVSRQTPHAAVLLFLPALTAKHPTTPKHQPAPTTPAISFLTEQISDSLSPATSLSPTPFNFHPFRPPTFKHSASPFSINFPPKKLSRRLSFSRCI